MRRGAPQAGGIVKLKVFFAGDGDCLLLTSSDGRHALIDGGRAESFEQQTWPELQKLGAIDLVVVSHIDDDHISGVLWLMRIVAAWTVYDYQRGAGRNRSVRKPSTSRPPDIAGLWHNSWRDQLGDLAAPIEESARRLGQGLPMAALDGSGPPPGAIDKLQGLGDSIDHGFELLRIVDDQTPVPRNAAFDKDLVMLRHPPLEAKLGRTKLTVIGPGDEHLERLRKEWRKWIEKLGDGTSLAEAATIIKSTKPSEVTPPNRASITLLAEERRRSCLLTGDAHEEEIIEGLDAAGKIVNGTFRCNVVKVQHHGSEKNLSERFAATVLADHYILCADGAHENPSPSVIKTIAETRFAKDPRRPFTLHFNTTPARTRATRREALREAIDEARAAARRHPGITVNVLDRAQPYFELTV
jgi:beta-lactamase superfamily II metal-dependent hydrolase